MTTKPLLKNFSKENRATQKQNSKRVFIKIKDQMLISEASGWNEQDKKAHQAHQAHRAHQVVFENYIFFGALFYLFRKR